MADVIVVFPNKDNAINIRNILTRGGCEVIGVCTTGAQVLHYTELLDEGIVVCGYKLADMLYTELREYLPKEVAAKGILLNRTLRRRLDQEF